MMRPPLMYRLKNDAERQVTNSTEERDLSRGVSGLNDDNQTMVEKLLYEVENLKMGHLADLEKISKLKAVNELLEERGQKLKTDVQILELEKVNMKAIIEEVCGQPNSDFPRLVGVS